MNNALKITALLSLFVFAFFFFQKKAENTHPMPTETIVLQSEEDSEGQLKRNDWIESMHRAAPEINWRTIEYQTQVQRAKNRARTANSLTLRNGGLADTLANGTLIGTWKERGSNNQAGSVFDTEYDAATDEIWLISAGGTLWRGKRDGSLWEVVNQDFQFSTGTLRFLPLENGRRLIATIGNIPHYSDDDGVTWTASTGIPINDGWGRAFQPQFMDDTTSIYILSKPDYWSNWKIYKSSDKGETFEQTGAYAGNDEGDNKLALCKPFGTNDLYYIRKTTSGVALHQVNTTTSANTMLSNSSDFTLNRPNLVGTSTETDTIFYVYDAGNTIYKTSDFGENWTMHSEIPDTPWDVSMYLSPTDTATLYTGGLNAFRSADGGQNWDLVNEWWEYYGDVETKLHADMMAFREFETADGQPFVLISHHGGLSVSYDYMETTENISLAGLNVSQYYSVKSSKHAFLDQYLIIGGSQDQGLQRSIDEDFEAIADFDQVISGDYGHVVFTNNGSSFWTVYPGGWVTYYGNGFDGQYDAEYDLVSEHESVWIPPLHSTLKEGENTIYMAGGNIDGENGSYLIKLDASSGFDIEATQFDYNFREFSGGEVSSIEVSPLNNDHIFVATTNGRFFYTTDGGENWEQNVNFYPEGHYLYGQTIYASKIDTNTVYLAGSGYSNPAIYRSTDGGNFFSSFIEGLPPTLVFELTANADETLLFAASEAGPFVYVFEEESWFDLSGLCAPSQTYWSVEFLDDLNVARFGTYGRGIWDFSIDYQYINSLSETPKALSIKAFPNPTTDELHLELPEKVSQLQLHDWTGKLVKTISISQQNITLHMRDLPRGIYVLSGENMVQKVVLQ